MKSNKSDIIDAEAIAEAATRPTMRFAAIKSEEQADLQALHRVRDQMIGTRTRLINQMRAFCLEYGIALRQGAGLFKLDRVCLIHLRLENLLHHARITSCSHPGPKAKCL